MEEALPMKFTLSYDSGNPIKDEADAQILDLEETHLSLSDFM